MNTAVAFVALFMASSAVIALGAGGSSDASSLIYCVDKQLNSACASASGGQAPCLSAPSTACTSASVATAFYNKSMWTTGWDVLKVTPLDWTDAKQAYYYAGYIEGYLTQDTMWATYQNSIVPLGITPAVASWVQAHHDYMTQMAATPTTPFWTQVGKLLKQIDGIADGYAAAVAKSGNQSQALTPMQVFYLSFEQEFFDILVITQNNITYNPNWKSSGPEEDKRLLAHPPKGQRGHCSGFIKYTGDDLFLTHVTWTQFTDMYRQFKVYNFETNVSLSGYPGMIHSVDDWYETSHKLAVMETTNLLYNNSVYYWVTNQSVSEFLRVMTANYLASNSSYWIDLVGTQNSGTYNNQWMVVDMKLVKLGAANMMDAIPDGTFWIYEQLPGPFARQEDVSWHLRQHSYWKSYNLPYFKSIFYASGNQMMEDMYGSYFSYEKYARPEIFKREQGGVKTLDDVKRLMRYNNYTMEPFSLIPNCSGEPDNKCQPAYSAMLTISSRGDLDNVNTTLLGPLATPAAGYQVGFQNHGAIDNKIASYKMMMADPKINVGTLVCGPTTSGGLAVFNWQPWSQFGPMNRYMLPDKYDFDYTIQTSETPMPSIPPATSSAPSANTTTASPTWIPTTTPPPNGTHPNATNTGGVATNAGLAAGVIIGALAFVAVLFFAVRQFQKHTQAKYGKATEATALNA